MISWVLFLVFLTCMAMLWNEGLWGNAISLINVTLAALIATNYFEPVAGLLEEQMPSYTFVWDFMALWLVFALTFAVLRAITDLLSRYRVRFKMPVEHAGRVLLAMWVGWVMVCFTDFSLNTAPLARHSFRGSFQETPDSGNFFGISPSHLWLGLVQSRSEGALSRGGEGQVFDPKSEFLFKYGQRREMLHVHNILTNGRIRVNTGTSTAP